MEKKRKKKLKSLPTEDEAREGNAGKKVAHFVLRWREEGGRKGERKGGRKGER